MRSERASRKDTMPSKTLPGPTEHQIMTSIVGFLQWKGYYVQRMNSGKFVVGAGASRRMIQGARPGTPDIMAFKLVPGMFLGSHSVANLLFVEVKRPGKKATPLQEAVMAELEGQGARCLIAHSVEEVEEALK